MTELTLPTAKDRDGVTERLRADDVINFTAVGYELIAQSRS